MILNEDRGRRGKLECTLCGSECSVCIVGVFRLIIFNSLLSLVNYYECVGGKEAKIEWW